ncbi:TIGR00341 family protein [Halorubrum ezzemoulense]|uniref:TIGR00341 family protein n=1 Tax=Halorubrum ezzemoulense TaxID=337243 RepID=A0ABT4YZQ3_HALEZ|nr:TIGR00341 family protein [Halorubrum ezzemoulense]MDB2223342.1 TIGR00341 family protein [Halorubrum ezzemoulense]MDB2240713.1 TIGR00341 family protein [Halorubrum ezzemoulense]MDB2243413.1 TIGR00341 family protein [Halorubrum ezzemoulense]MDB2251479.1 TIGR00341 family protein [Halorubrum ezzemoulense]MDB2264215.1 TIGR00341 family protein [Halorubrum ezzemoulense]
MIPAGKRAAVVRALDDEGVDYVVTDETSGREYTAVATFPLPTAAVEPVLDRLREAGIDESTYTVIVAAETVISRRFEALEEEYEADAERSGDRISREELQAKADDLASGLGTYVLMTVISSVIATAGLLLDSPATVVGSMVIAPLIGPAMSAAIGTVVDDEALFRRGVRMQVIGVAVAVIAATAFAFALRSLALVPPGLDPLELAEVSERLAPNVLVLVVAVGAGIAGIVSLMTGVSATLVGVMIAVALIPPAAAVGIGIAFRIPRLVIGAGVIVAVNVLSINLSALVMLWYEGYRPQRWFREDEARAAFLKRAAVLAVAIALLSVFLGGVTYESYVASTTEADIRAAASDELTALDAEFELLDLTVERTGTVPPLKTDRVVIRVGTPPGGTVEGLAPALDDRIESVVGGEVEVEVRSVTVERA